MITLLHAEFGKVYGDVPQNTFPVNSFIIFLRYTANDTNDGVVESRISFEKIVIKGIFPKDNVFTLPNSLNFNLSPYPTTDFTYEEVTNEQ